MCKAAFKGLGLSSKPKKAATLCMLVCLCACVCVCLYMQVCVFGLRAVVCVATYKGPRSSSKPEKLRHCVCMRVCICVYVRAVCKCVYVCVFVHVCMHIHLCACLNWHILHVIKGVSKLAHTARYQRRV